MSTITLLTSNSTNAPSPSITPAGRVAVARGASNPALFLTADDRNIGISPALVSNTASGRQFQLVFRPTSDKLSFYYGGQEYSCYPGLQGVTNGDTTMLGALDTPNTQNGPIGATLVALRLPSGTESSKSVVVTTSNLSSPPPDGSVSIGRDLSRSGATTVIPATLDTFPDSENWTISGFKPLSPNVPREIDLTALGPFSCYWQAKSSPISATHVGKFANQPIIAQYSTFVTTGVQAGTSGASFEEFGVCALGASSWKSFGKKSVSLGALNRIRGNQILIGSALDNISADICIVPGRPNLSTDSRGVRIGSSINVQGTNNQTNLVILGPYFSGGGQNYLTINQNGAVTFSNVPSYGTAGQVLTSSGTGASPKWTTPATSTSYSFTSADGKTVVIRNGLIVSIS